MTPVLVLHDISKSFQCGVPVLQQVQLQVEAGQTVCLLGPSGCGKTTLLRLIAGFEAPDAGEIYLAKRLVSRPGLVVPPERRHVGMVFQDFALFPHMTVRQNIVFGLARWSSAWRLARLAEMLRLVGLEDVASRYPHELSGGQQQRVALARALAPNPQILLLDEPFSNLDVAFRQQLREEVQTILQRAGITTVLVTHDQEEALSLANTLAVIERGRIVQSATPDEVIAHPRTPFVAQFLALGQLLAGEIHDCCLVTEMGRVPLTSVPALPVGCRQVDVLIRPECVQLSDDRQGMPAQVIQASFHGTRKRYTLRLPSGTLLRALFPRHVVLTPGEQVRVILRLTGLVVFPRLSSGIPPAGGHALRIRTP
jgi:iron(III) transport system ATP-binding protein